MAQWLPKALLAASAAALFASPALATPPIGPWLHPPNPPPERPPPLPPEPPPTITARDSDGRVILLDAGAEQAAARALPLDTAALARLESAVDRHHADLAQLAVNHLGFLLRSVLPARADLDRVNAPDLRRVLDHAAALSTPSLLDRLEREGILTLQQRQRAQAAVDAHHLAATEDAALAAAAAADGPEEILTAKLRTDVLLATGEWAAAMDRLLLAAADRWPLIEPTLPIPPDGRQSLAAAVGPALDLSTPAADRARAMALALTDLNLEVAAAALRAASPEQFATQRPQRLPTPLRRPE